MYPSGFSHFCVGMYYVVTFSSYLNNIFLCLLLGRFVTTFLRKILWKRIAKLRYIQISFLSSGWIIPSWPQLASAPTWPCTEWHSYAMQLRHSGASTYPAFHGPDWVLLWDIPEIVSNPVIRPPCPMPPSTVVNFSCADKSLAVARGQILQKMSLSHCALPTTRKPVTAPRGLAESFSQS